MAKKQASINVTRQHLKDWIQKTCSSCHKTFRVGDIVQGYNGGMVHKACL